MPVPAMAERNSRVLGRTVEDLVFSINMKAGFMVCDTVCVGDLPAGMARPAMNQQRKHQ